MSEIYHGRAVLFIYTYIHTYIHTYCIHTYIQDVA